MGHPAPSPNQPPTGTATVTTTYAYDALNRGTGKSYHDTYSGNGATPGVAFGYDGVALSGCTTAPPSLTDNNPLGLRTAMCDGSGGTSWAHDKMGRILKERRTIGTVSGDYENDTFNLDGSVASVTSLGYGVIYTYGGAARPLTAKHSGANLVTGASYAPPGEMTAMTLGSTTGFAGITVANAYNDRLQPILLSATSPSGTVFSDCFNFHLGVQITGPAPCSFSASTAGDNGNVYQIANNRDTTRNQNFIYDSLNRIQQAYSSGTQWGETFGPTATSPGVAPATPGIDAWGNLTKRSGVTGKTYNEPLSVSAGTNNQLSGFGYDAAGNMTSNGSTSYVYDAENRSIWTSGYRYLYDGSGERVEKCVAATSTTACPTSGANGTLYWKGAGSDPLSETDLSGNVTNTYIFFNGQRIARSDSAGAIHYYFSDHLGSHGVVENATGSACEQDIDYYPYGGQEHDYCANVAQNYKFTGKERDTESGLDNFGARYDASALGRFMTPDWSEDPAPVPYSDFSDPQTLNLYGYARNNPLAMRDFGGHNPERCDPDTFVTNKDGSFTVIAGACHKVADNKFYAMAVLSFENEELGPWISWGGAATFLAIGCYQTQCLNFFKSNNAAPPANAASGNSTTASPNPPGGPNDKYKANKNKLDHVFEAKHKLGSLVQKYGSEHAAYQAISEAADQQLTGSGVANGIQAQIQVGGETVTVTGFNSPSGYVVANAWIP